MRINLEVVEMINQQLPPEKQISLRWALEVALGIEVYDLTISDNTLGRMIIKLAPNDETAGDDFRRALSMNIVFGASIFQVGEIGETKPDPVRAARYPKDYKLKVMLMRQVGFTSELTEVDKKFAAQLMMAVLQSREERGFAEVLEFRSAS